MSKRPAKKPPEEGAPEWMMTFGDLMSQLLTFFILLISFSIFDEIKYNNVKGALDQSFGLLPAWDQPIVPKERLVKEVEKYNTEEERIRGIGYQLKIRLGTQGQAKDVEAITTKEGLLLRLKEDPQEPVYFDTARATLKPEAYPVLDIIVEAIKDLPNEIRVSGHTDSRRVKAGGKFASNWELSTARARSVQQYFVEKGIDEEKTSITGYAHVKPIADENLADPAEKEEAWRINRRVEILIVRQHDIEIEAVSMEAVSNE